MTRVPFIMMLVNGGLALLNLGLAANSFLYGSATLGCVSLGFAVVSGFATFVMWRSWRAAKARQALFDQRVAEMEAKWHAEWAELRK